MKKFKFAIIGCGAIFDLHADAIISSDDAELAAVCDRNPEALKRAAEKYPSARIYTDYKKMLEEAEADVIDIITPPASHAILGVEAAGRGKHIIVEKPIDVSLEAADRLIKECSKNNVKLGCIFQNRFQDGILALKKAVGAGLLGRLNFGGSYTRWWREQSYYDGRKASGSFRSDGGGALINQSIHYIDLLLDLMGPVGEVFGRTASLAHNDIGVEDLGVATVVFKSGALGIIEGTTGAYPGFDTQLEINGDEGTIVIKDNKIVAWHIRDGTPAPQLPEQIETPHRRQIMDFIDAVKTGREPVVSCLDARRALEVVLAVYESSRTGKPVKIG